MASQPLVSIIVTNYNYGRFIQAAIDSAIQQTYRQIEIIVVDDGSTDESRDIIASYGNRILRILKPNGGQGSAYNAGFVVSTGSIICLLDSDDIFAADKVARIVEIFQLHSEIGSCFHMLSSFDETGDTVSIGHMVLTGELDFRIPVRKGRMPLIPTASSGLSFRRDLLDRIFPLPESGAISVSEGNHLKRTSLKSFPDHYLKWTSLALSPTYFLNQQLARQRIHDANWYTSNSDKLATAGIQIMTAVWMRKYFPYHLSKWSNRVFANGLGVYWRQEILPPDLQIPIDSFLTMTSVWERVLIRLLALSMRFQLERRAHAVLRHSRWSSRLRSDL